MSDRHTSLGERLRALRQRQKLTSKDVADAVGITQSHLCAIERGTSNNPRFQVLTSLAKFYGVSVSALIGEADDGDTEAARQLLYWFQHRLSSRDQGLLYSMADQMQRRD